MITGKRRISNTLDRNKGRRILYIIYYILYIIYYILYIISGGFGMYLLISMYTLRYRGSASPLIFSFNSCQRILISTFLRRAECKNMNWDSVLFVLRCVWNRTLREPYMYVTSHTSNDFCNVARYSHAVYRIHKSYQFFMLIDIFTSVFTWQEACNVYLYLCSCILFVSL